jgi:hypothetical protein
MLYRLLVEFPYDLKVEEGHNKTSKYFLSSKKPKLYLSNGNIQPINNSMLSKP